MYNLNERVYSIVNNMQSNYAGRGFSAKLVGDQIILVMSAQENDFRSLPIIEGHLKEAFNQTIVKIKEQYEEQYGYELELELLSEQMDNQPLGWRYDTGRGTGAFMGNAGQAVRSALFRVIRLYSVSSPDAQSDSEE